MSECQYKKLVCVPLVPGISVHVGSRLFTALASFIFIYLLAGQSGSQSLYLLSAAILATIVLGVLVPFFQILDTKVSVVLPHQAIAGEKINIQLRPAHAFLPGIWSTIFPLRLVSLAVDLSRQNGEIISVCEAPAVADGIEKESSIEALTIPLKRGLYKFHALTASTCFPFAMCWWSTKLPVNFGDSSLVNNRLTVYPQAIKITGKLLQSSEAGSTSTGKLNEKNRALQESCSVRGLRPYRSGDSPRWIHWKSTARGGRLIIKEFDDETIADQFIFLDSEAPWQSEEQFELAVCLANSIIHHQSSIEKRRLLVPPSRFVDEVLAMPQCLERSNEILARVQSSPVSVPVDYATIEETSLARIQSLFDETLKMFPHCLIFAVIPGVDAITVNLIEITFNKHGRHHNSRAKHLHPLVSRNIVTGEKRIATLDKPNAITDCKRIIARVAKRSQIGLL